MNFEDRLEALELEALLLKVSYDDMIAAYEKRRIALQKESAEAESDRE